MIVHYSTKVPQKHSNKVNQMRAADIEFKDFQDFFNSYLKTCFYFNHYVHSRNKDFSLIFKYFNKVCTLEQHTLVPFEIKQIDNGQWLVGGYILEMDCSLTTVEFIIESLDELQIVSNKSPAAYCFQKC